MITAWLPVWLIKKTSRRTVAVLSNTGSALYWILWVLRYMAIQWDGHELSQLVKTKSDRGGISICKATALSPPQWLVMPSGLESQRQQRPTHLHARVPLSGSHMWWFSSCHLIAECLALPLVTRQQQWEGFWPTMLQADAWIFVEKLFWLGVLVTS